MKPEKNTLKIGSLVVLIFAAGFLAGIGTVGTFLYCNRPPAPPPMDGPPGFEHPADRMHHMAETLGLDESQRSRVEEIIKHTGDRLHELRLQHRPAVEKILEESRVEIRAILTDDQKKRFDNMVEKRKKRFDRMRPGRKRTFSPNQPPAPPLDSLPAPGMDG